MFCVKCGNELSDGEKFCSKCGTIVDGKSANTNVKGKNIRIILLVVVALIGIGAIVFAVTYCLPNTLSETEKEALLNVEALYNTKNNNLKNKQEIMKLLSSNSNNSNEIKENDFNVLDIKRIDEEKLEKKLNQKIDKSEIKNEYGGVYFDENGDVRKKEDDTDYKQYNFFAIKYYYEGKMQIAIYIGGYEFNSSEYEDLGIGSWVRDSWDMNIFTNDTYDTNRIMSQITRKP